MEAQTVKTKKKEAEVADVRVNPLRNEKVYVRFVPKNNGLSNDHVASGGKVDGATTTLCVPILRSTGNYKNILTNDEKDYLEEVLGMDFNALSVYKKEDNYWDNYRVTINTKEGLTLDLSNPEDYIRYKVLVANSDIVAPSVQERLDRPKATYQFEIVRKEDETRVENARMDATMQSYKEFGKIDSDLDTMRVLVEILDARPYSPNEKADFLRSRINVLIQSDAKKFLSAITDPLLHTKVIIRRAVELGVITKRGDYYYTKDNSPLCESGEDPTLSIAAKYLNIPSHQDLKFILESEVGKNKGKK
jgi:hypothetical protein